MKKNIVLWLVRPYGSDKYICITQDNLEVGDFVNMTNGYYDEPHKAFESEFVIIAEKEYKRIKLIGTITEHITYIYKEA